MCVTFMNVRTIAVHINYDYDHNEILSGGKKLFIFWHLKYKFRN